MSRWVSLNQARAKVSANSSGFSRKRREIFSYAGSMRIDKSVVSIVGARRLAGSCACGMVPVPPPFLAAHCCAPAGLFVNSHSKPNRFSKYSLVHCVGLVVQVTSRPLVIVSPPLPLPKLLCQPKPCASMPADWGSSATWDEGAAPWVLPKVWPPAISATVSSSPIAMRAKVSRMSWAEATGSGLPSGPSGLT